MIDRAQGYRGYIGSRPYTSGDYPQNVQNLIIRTFCQKNKFTYLLSATEYIMPNCYMILEEVIQSIESLEGIVLFSIFMLPDSAEKRKRIYDKILSANRTLHAALEDLSIRNKADIQAVEDVLTLNKITLTERHLPELHGFLTAQ